MKKKYLKPSLELVDIASSTNIALTEVSQNSGGVLNFTDNQGESMTWVDFFK